MLSINSKKKAGDIENGARKFKDTVVSKVDEFKAKKKPKIQLRLQTKKKKKER